MRQVVDPVPEIVDKRVGNRAWSAACWTQALPTDESDIIIPSRLTSQNQLTWEERGRYAAHRSF